MRVKSQYGEGTLVWVGIDQTNNKVTYRILLDHTTDFKTCDSLEIKCPRTGWLRFGPDHPQGPCDKLRCLFQVNVFVHQIKNIYYTLAHSVADAQNNIETKIKDKTAVFEHIKLLAKADPIEEPVTKKAV